MFRFNRAPVLFMVALVGVVVFLRGHRRTSSLEKSPERFSAKNTQEKTRPEIGTATTESVEPELSFHDIPESATDYRGALERLGCGSASGLSGEDGQRLLTAWAKENPLTALKYVLSEVSPPWQTDMLGLVINVSARSRDYATVVKLLGQISDSGLQSTLLSRVAMQRAQEEPLKTALWLLELSPHTDLREALISLGRTWAESEPQQAAEFAVQLPAGELRQGILTAAMQVWINKAPGPATLWLDQFDAHPDFDHVAAEIVRIPGLMDRKLDVALTWAESIADDNQRTQSLSVVIESWLNRDRSSAINYIQNSLALNPIQRATLIADFGLAE